VNRFLKNSVNITINEYEVRIFNYSYRELRKIKFKSNTYLSEQSQNIKGSHNDSSTPQQKISRQTLIHTFLSNSTRKLI